ncbi:MAG TPA: SDR family oxidoreductase [Acidimicrobiales bacterium]|nr:SDR family oxidoreductase [Acidimicrobiales bacterium]
MQPYEYRGKTALVTGASSGIGKAFAEELVVRGVDRVILVARRETVLREVGDALVGSKPVRVDVIAEDLSLPGAHRQVAAAVASLGATVDVLVNSAGFGTYGLLQDLADTTLQEEMSLNCATLVGLTAAFLPGMQSRGSGVIVNVSSTAAFQPLPYMAVYAATKAFVLSFTEALWGENRHSGVRLLALCPGPTETPFFDRVGAAEASVGRRQSPDTVVAVALRAVDQGRPVVVCGWPNAVLARMPRLVPARPVIILAGRTLRPRSRRTHTEATHQASPGSSLPT